MRIAHCADLHIGTNHKRWPTLLRSLDLMIEGMIEARPDLICIAGDIGEPHPNARDLEAIASFLIRVTSIGPCVACAGNHENTAYWPLFSKLETVHPLWLSTRPESIALYGEDELRLLDDLPSEEMMAVGAVIHTMPWPSRGMLLSLLPRMPAPEETDRIVRDLLTGIFVGFRAERAQKNYIGPSVLLGHLDVSGAKTDAGQPQVGAGMKVSIEDLAAADTSASLLGHIHARQELGDDGEGIFYSGSPCRLTWGEAGAAGKGWGLLAFNSPILDRPWRGMEYLWQDIPSPRLHAVEATWEQGLGPMGESLEWGFDGCFGGEIAGAGPGDFLRFRYHVPEDQRDAARAAVTDVIADIWPHAIEQVTVEAVTIPTAHARAPEIARMDDPVEMLERWLQAESLDVSEDRRNRLRSFLRDIVQEVG